MPKAPKGDVATQEKPMFPFLEMAEKSAEKMPAKALAGKSGDKVTDAKMAIKAMIKKQKDYADMKEAGKTLPLSPKGERTVAMWFDKNAEGYWTNIRWGQRSLNLGGQTAWFFSSVDKLKAFYDSIEENIDTLDPAIKLAMKR